MGEQDKQKAATPQAEVYNGTYTVTNCTGDTITDFSALADTGAGKYPVTAGSLGPGATVGPVKFQARTGSSDDWSVTFVRGGRTYNRNGKQCNFETEDANQNVAITLSRDQFSIVTPTSNPCIRNSYS